MVKGGGHYGVLRVRVNVYIHGSVSMGAAVSAVPANGITLPFPPLLGSPRLTSLTTQSKTPQRMALQQLPQVPVC